MNAQIGHRVTQSVLQALADEHRTTVLAIRAAVIARRPGIEQQFQRMMDAGIQQAITHAVAERRAERRARITS